MGLRSPGAESAVQAFRSALALHQKLGDVAGQVQLLQKISVASLGKEKLKDALEAAQEACSLSKGRGDAEAAAQLFLANMRIVMGFFDEAIADASAARQLCEASGNSGGVTAALLTVVSAHLAKERVAEAEASVSEILSLSPDKRTEGFAIHARALIRVQQGEQSEAARIAAEAVPCFDVAGQKSGQAIVLYTLVSAHLADRHDAQAFEAAHELVAACQDAGATVDGAGSLQALGELCMRMGRPDGAIRAVKKALLLIDGDAVPSVRVSLLQTLFSASMVKGGDHNYSVAIRACEEALRLVRERALKGEAGWLLAAAQAHLHKGESMPALRESQQALAMFKASGEKKEEAAATSTLASVLLKQRVDLDEAIRVARTAEGLFKELGDTQGQGSAMATIANAYLLNGELSQAMGHAKSSESLFEQARDEDSLKVVRELAAIAEKRDEVRSQEGAQGQQTASFERAKFGWRSEPHKGLHWTMIMEPRDPEMRLLSGLTPNLTLSDGIRSACVPVVHGLRAPSMYEAPGKDGWCVHVIGSDCATAYGKTIATSLHTLTAMVTARLKNLTYVQVGERTRKEGSNDVSASELAMSPVTLAMLRTARIEAPNMNIGYVAWDTASWNVDRANMLANLPALHDEWECEVYYNQGTPLYPRLENRPMEGVIDKFADSGVEAFRKATAKVK